MLRAIMGLAAEPAPRVQLPLGIALPGNGPREHYMRARLGAGNVVPFDRQDSSLLSILADANALIVRPVSDGPRHAGELVDTILLDKANHIRG